MERNSTLAAQVATDDDVMEMRNQEDAPVSRPLQHTGIISSHAILGGLQHHYARAQGFRYTLLLGNFDLINKSRVDGKAVDAPKDAPPRFHMTHLGRQR
jgi:hypothetical protein